MPQAQSSPWCLSEYQWALSPPLPQTSSMSSSQGSPSPFDARYAQERRPSLKAQWEAIFPNEKLDGSLSASSCSTSFSSDYAGAGSVSPLWGAGLLPSLSINEPPYTDAAPLPSALPGMLVGDATLNTKSPEVKTEISSPLQFAFAAPSMAQVTVPQYSFWPPALEGQVASNPAPSGLLGMSPGSPSLNVTPMAQSDQPTLFDITQLVPAQQQPMTSLHTAARPLPVSQVEPSPVFSSLHSTQHVQPLADMPEWWPYRHMKVKPDENEGVPLEELLRSFEQRGSL